MPLSHTGTPLLASKHALVALLGKLTPWSRACPAQGHPFTLHSMHLPCHAITVSESASVNW